MRKTHLLFLYVVFAFWTATFAFANGWEKDDRGYKYQRDNSYCFNTFIEDGGYTYYIANDGYMVSKSWIKLSDSDWYYADSSGKIFKDGKKVIDNKIYIFDKNGKLKKGWIDGTYYANDQGYLVKGWQHIPVDTNEVVRKSEDDTAWFYFKEDGSKICAENTGVIVKTFDDRKYCFDERGIMQVGWVEVHEGQTPRIKGYMYFADQETSKFKYGQAITGTWFAAPSPDFANLSEEVAWYYFTMSGYPKCGAEDKYQKIRIDEKYYLFNDYGNPVSGVRKSGDSYYYFGDNRNDCSMKTGMRTVVDGSGTANTYYFREVSGEGYTGVKDNKIFYKGRLQKADKGTKYQAFKINGSVYLVNTQGILVKGKKNVKDADGYTWNTNANGIATSPDGGEYVENILPEPNED